MEASILAALYVILATLCWRAHKVNEGRAFAVITVAFLFMGFSAVMSSVENALWQVDGARFVSRLEVATGFELAGFLLLAAALALFSSPAQVDSDK